MPSTMYTTNAMTEYTCSDTILGISPPNSSGSSEIREHIIWAANTKNHTSNYHTEQRTPFTDRQEEEQNAFTLISEHLQTLNIHQGAAFVRYIQAASTEHIIRSTRPATPWATCRDQAPPYTPTEIPIRTSSLSFLGGICASLAPIQTATAPPPPPPTKHVRFEAPDRAHTACTACKTETRRPACFQVDERGNLRSQAADSTKLILAAAKESYIPSCTHGRASKVVRWAETRAVRVFEVDGDGSEGGGFADYEEGVVEKESLFRVKEKEMRAWRRAELLAEGREYLGAAFQVGDGRLR